MQVLAVGLAALCIPGTTTGLVSTLLSFAPPSHHHKLPAGSFLNAGNKDGAASGFQVDALLRLKDVRSTRARCVCAVGLFEVDDSKERLIAVSCFSACPDWKLPAARVVVQEPHAAALCGPRSGTPASRRRLSGCGAAQRGSGRSDGPGSCRC